MSQILSKAEYEETEAYVWSFGEDSYEKYLSRQQCDAVESSTVVSTAVTPTPAPENTYSVYAHKDIQQRVNQLGPLLGGHIEAGNRVLLLWRDGKDTKRPLMEGWNDPEIPNPTFDDIKREHIPYAIRANKEITGIGVVNGPMSRNRHVLDFDMGEFYEPMRKRIIEKTGFDLDTLAITKSGRATGVPGKHVIFRSTESRKTQLGLAKHLIPETKALKSIVDFMGTDSQTVSAGSLHRSGLLYTVEHGDVVNPPVIDTATMDGIIEVIRSFDETPPEVKVKAVRKERTFTPNVGNPSIIDEYNARTAIEDVLEAHGYSRVNSEWFRHPNNGGNEKEVHLIGPNLCHHFSPNDPMGAGTTSNPFSIVCELDYHGDAKEAVKELAKQMGMDQPKRSRQAIDGQFDCRISAEELVTIDPAAAVWPARPVMAEAVRPTGTPPEAPASLPVVTPAAEAALETPKPAEATTTAPEAPPVPRGATSPTTNGIILQRMSDVVERPVQWIWNNRIAVGKLGLLAGDPGTGKSFLSMDIAARVTTGAMFPDSDMGDNHLHYQERRQPGDVILMSAEDDPEDTIVPRLRKAGADLSRVSVLKAKVVAGKQHEVTMADLPAIERALMDRPEAKLLIIDPIGAFVGNADSHNDAEVRGLLHPLSTLAQKYMVAVLLIAHLNKEKTTGRSKAIYRVMGSIGWIGTCRNGHLLAADPQDKERKLFLPIKNNLGPVGFGMAYRIVGGERLQWEPSAIEGTADEIIDARTPRHQPERDEAREFIEEELAGGPVEAAEIIEEAKQTKHIAATTLRRAAKELGVKIEKTGFNNGWTWSL